MSTGRRARAVGRWLARTYASADPRSLGLFRIALGALLFCDVARRMEDIPEHYSNLGWLTNHFALFRPMSEHLFSIYHAFSKPEAVMALAGVHLLVNFLLIVGWKTRVMQVLAAILITSLNSRNIAVENGGYVVTNLLAVWSMFLPLDRRFSVDAWLRSWRSRREGTLKALNEPCRREHRPVVSLAVTALILQWAVIYFFNTVHKTGSQWQDGTAVYYFFQQDRILTGFGVWLRDLLPLDVMRGLTWSTLAIEGTLVALLLVPVKTHVFRMLGAVLACVLHGSIDSVIELGPFSWAMIIMFLALVPPGLWNGVRRWLGARKSERRVWLDPTDGASLTFARIVRRLDVLGHVQFVSSRDEAPKGHTFAESFAAAEAASADRTLVVSDEADRTSIGGKALARLGQAIPLGGLLAPLGWSPCRGLMDRLIARVMQRRRALSAFFETRDLPGRVEQAPPPPPVRTVLRRSAAGAGQLLVVVLMVACGSQVLSENAALHPDLRQWMREHRPEWMQAMVVYPRLFQGWSMFAPAPPLKDGRLVVVGTTQDGRRLDPLTGRSPTFQVQPPGSARMNQIWGYFHRRIGEQRFQTYLQGVRDFVRNHHELTHRPEDRLIHFELWYVTRRLAPPGKPRQPSRRRKLLTWGSMD